MRYFQGLFAVLLLFVMEGCKNFDWQITKIVRSDSALQAEYWESISMFESGISIRGEQGEVLQRLAKRDASQKIYTEAMRLEHGNMLFERRGSVSVNDFRLAEQELLRRYNKNKEFKRFDIQLVLGNLKHLAHTDGDIVYATWRGGGHKCVIFFRYSKATRPPSQEKNGSYEAVTGAFCVQIGSRDAIGLEEEVLDIASRVVFDNGKSARAGMLEAGLARLNGDITHLAHDKVKQGVTPSKSKQWANRDVEQDQEADASTTDTRNIGWHVREFWVVGLAGSKTIFLPSETKKITDSYVGQLVTLEELFVLRDKLALLYVNKGYIISKPIIVERPTASGVVVIRIPEF
ncbi:MAG: hypothetical protein HQM06_16910 [Magnetococcales bacterium]|nr:hypothetical protein [Magnetococcales bacterium]